MASTSTSVCGCTHTAAALSPSSGGCRGKVKANKCRGVFAGGARHAAAKIVMPVSHRARGGHAELQALDTAVAEDTRRH